MGVRGFFSWSTSWFLASRINSGDVQPGFLLAEEPQRPEYQEFWVHEHLRAREPWLVASEIYFCGGQPGNVTADLLVGWVFLVESRRQAVSGAWLAFWLDVLGIGVDLVFFLVIRRWFWSLFALSAAVLAFGDRIRRPGRARCATLGLAGSGARTGSRP